MYSRSMIRGRRLTIVSSRMSQSLDDVVDVLGGHATSSTMRGDHNQHLYQNAQQKPHSMWNSQSGPDGMYPVHSPSLALVICCLVFFSSHCSAAISRSGQQPMICRSGYEKEQCCFEVAGSGGSWLVCPKTLWRRVNAKGICDNRAVACKCAVQVQSTLILQTVSLPAITFHRTAFAETQNFRCCILSSFRLLPKTLTNHCALGISSVTGRIAVVADWL